MVKVKILNVEFAYDEKYIGKTYDAFKMTYKYDTGHYYMAKVEDYNLLYVKPEDCEEIDDRPMLACAEEPKIKIGMKDIMDSLGITVGDIVCVNAKGTHHYLKCNEKYDLTHVNSKYDEMIPNLILGMVSGKHDYTVYSVAYECIQSERR